MQFSLRNALIATAAVSVACAGLVYANIWWAGLFITLAALIAGVSLVGAFAASGIERGQWIGCFVFGAGYLLLVYGPHVDRVIGPTLLTAKVLAWAQPKVQRTPSALTRSTSDPTPLASPWLIAASGGTSVPWGGGGTIFVSNGILPQWEPFQQVGHGFASMLAGVCGAAVGAGMAKRRKQGAPEPAA